MEIIFPGVLIITAALAVYAVLSYNRLIKARQMVGEAWSGMDVQLKRRANLIPNLVETVKGYAQHELDVMTRVTAARTATQKVPKDDVSGRATTEGALGSAMGSLIAVAEEYPDLRASENFQGLQSNLAQVETDLQHARRYFNATVRDLNTRIESFPSALIAGQLGWTPLDYFEIQNHADRAAPTVDFKAGGRQ